MCINFACSFPLSVILSLFLSRWYHLCFTYNHLTHLYNTFVNGEFVYEVTYDVGRQIYGDYVRLGQSNEIFETYSGALSQVRPTPHYSKTSGI